MRKRIAIIGAGPAGLTAAKACQEYDMTPIVFEKSSRVGGVWSGADNGGAAWTGMRTNLSKWSCMFSDFLWSDETQDFPFQNEMANYLQGYGDNFGVTSHIRFKAAVTNAIQENSGWMTSFNSRHEYFDGLINASGYFADGTIPDVTGRRNFKGRIMHSSKTRPDMISNDGRIVVCGGSLSGYEIATEFARRSNVPVTHVMRRSSWISKRYFPDGNGGTLPLDLACYSRKAQLEELRMSPTEKAAASIDFFKASFGDPKLFHPDLAVSEDLDDPVFAVVSDDYLQLVENKKIIPVRGIVQHYNERSVCVDAKKEIPADIVVWATGFKASLPFMGADIKSKIAYRENDTFMPALLHEAVWPKDIKNLGFVGWYRGPSLGIMELQARWVAAVFAGAVPAPTAAEIDAGIQKMRDLRNLPKRPQFLYDNYVEQGDILADKIGCRPNLSPSDRLFKSVNEGFSSPSHYRLMGPHANPEVTEQVIAQIPYMK